MDYTLSGLLMGSHCLSMGCTHRWYITPHSGLSIENGFYPLLPMILPKQIFFQNARSGLLILTPLCMIEVPFYKTTKLD
jgi:hypothetical protein